jgi:hypothetical protein
VSSDSLNDLAITYCERWNVLLKKPINVISSDRAAARYESGELFSAVVGDLTQPVVLIEIRWETDYAAVWFFDDKARRTLKYTFTRVDNRLFMSGVSSWTFPDEASGRPNEATRIELLTYSQDGVVHREAKDKTADDVLVEDYSNVDVVAHWQEVPEFGKWGGLARMERDATGEQRRTSR